MARRPNIIPQVRIHLYLPEDLMLKLEMLLYSPSERRVPHGAFSRFFESLIREHLAKNEEPIG